MSGKRDHGFPFDVVDDLKRELDYEYRGPERGFAQGVSLALAEAFSHGTREPQELQQAIVSELLRRTWSRSFKF